MTHELEESIARMFEGSLGLQCDYQMGSPKKKDFGVAGLAAAEKTKEIELDFLLPLLDFCVVGEVTTESWEGVKEHAKKLKQKLDFLRQAAPEKRFAPFNISEPRRQAYLKVEHLRGLLIYTKATVTEELRSYEDIVCLSGRHWQVVLDQADLLGRFAASHILDSIGIPVTTIADLADDDKEQLVVERDDMVRLSDKRFAQSTPKVDLYAFHIKPTKLLPIARVLRRSDLPVLIEDGASSEPTYQRLLIADKITALSKHIALIGTPHAFPTPILLLLGPDCSFDEEKVELRIPKRYGAVEVIDGQHRLHSYGAKYVSEAIRNSARLFVSAAQFPGAQMELAQRAAAHLFLEINTKQTRVASDHRFLVQFTLGETDSKSLAAGLIMALNRRVGVLKDVFNVSGLLSGEAVSITTVITGAARLFRLTDLRKRIASDAAVSVSWLSKFSEDYDGSVFEEGNEKEFMNAMTQCAGRYFGLIKKVFAKDWESEGSSILSSKFMSCWFGLLAALIERKADWDEIEHALQALRDETLKQVVKSYRDKKIAFADPAVLTHGSKMGTIRTHFEEYCFD